MLFETTLLKSEKLNFSTLTKIIFNENLEFSLTPQNSGNNQCVFQLHDFKGDFEIVRIFCTAGVKIPYDKENKTFVTVTNYSDYEYQFFILTNIDYKKVGYVYITYQLIFPKERARLLKLYEFYEEYFTLPEYEHIKFKYYVKKTKEGYVELSIEMPENVDLYDLNNSTTAKVEKFKQEASDSKDINLNLAFVFDPSDINTKNKTVTDSSSTTNYNNALYDIMSNTNYADVIIISSKEKEILSHRCVLAKYSTAFKKRIDESKEIPVKLNLQDFDTETIKAALDFCYGKEESINGMEAKLFGFASKYGFTDLKNACSVHFEKSVNPKNVCEIVEIAYSNNFENLKQKCYKMLAENKEKIDPKELEKLSKDILIKVLNLTLSDASLKFE